MCNDAGNRCGEGRQRSARKASLAELGRRKSEEMPSTRSCTRTYTHTCWDIHQTTGTGTHAHAPKERVSHSLYDIVETRT